MSCAAGILTGRGIVMLGRSIFNALASAARRWAVGRVIERARRARDRGGTQAASRVLSRGIERFPNAGELWSNLAALQIEQQAYPAAELSARRALERSPDLPQAHCNLGIVLAQRSEEDAASRCFERALELDPGLAAARENLARLLTGMARDAEAVVAWDGVLRLDPEHAEAHFAKGVLQLRAGLFDEARAEFARARLLGTEAPSVTLHEALIEAAVGDHQAARRAIASLRGRIEDADLDWNLALIHLSRGEFAEGWPLYEARLRKRFESPRRAYSFPEWTGAPLEPGALLVMGEQGLGDEIMFASCYPDVLERAPGCVIECDPRLAQLYARSFRDAAVVGVPRGNDRRWLEQYPALRCQIHAGSLPHLFRMSRERFPRHDGYLRADPQRLENWRGLLAGFGEGPSVGIAWSGGLAHTRRALRSVPLPELAPLLRGARHVFVSLQHDDDGSEAGRLAELCGTPVRVLAGALADLDEMAALLRALDVVITVCSSVAHLGGAVGATTWVLTPRVAEWRYLRSGETLPWYPRVKLLRQRRAGEWSPVVADAAAMLHALSGRHG